MTKKVTTLRFDEETLEIIKEHIKNLEKANPGVSISFSEAVNNLIHRGC